LNLYTEKLMKIVLFFLIVMLFSCEQKNTIHNAVLYGVETLSTEAPEFMLTMNYDETVAYFNRTDSNRANIYLMRSEKINGAWSPAKRITLFEFDQRIVDPFLSYDENYLFFSTNAFHDPNDQRDIYNVWYVKISDGKYSDPIFADGLNDKDHDDIYTSLTQSNMVAFSSSRRGDGKRDLYLSQFDGEKFSKPERVFIPGIQNQRPGNPGISADGNIIVFAARLKDNYGNSDLYFSKNTAKGWTPAKNLGPRVNSDNTEFTPIFSKDGKWLYFTSEKAGVVKDISGFDRSPGDFYRISTDGLFEIYQTPSN
jgi:Tol biopolymer transport system component